MLVHGFSAAIPHHKNPFGQHRVQLSWFHHRQADGFSDETHSHYGNKLAEASTNAAIAEDGPFSDTTLSLGLCVCIPQVSHHNSTTSVCQGKEELRPLISVRGERKRTGGRGRGREKGGRKRTKTAFFRNVFYFSNKILVLLKT